jgi:hypothetical protein
VAAAIERFEGEAHRFIPKALRAHAERFDRERFREAMRAWVQTRVAEGRGC